MSFGGVQDYPGKTEIEQYTSVSIKHRLLLVAGQESVLEVHTEKTKHTFMPCERKAGQYLINPSFFSLFGEHK